MSARRLQIQLQRDVLRWARERAGLTTDLLARKVGVDSDRVREWEESGQISVAQLDKLAHHTHTPIGYLSLQEPVRDELPIPDLRTSGDRPPTRPSLELLDTIRSMQRRQDWLRDELIESGQEPLGFIGSADLETPIPQLASSICGTLGLNEHWARAHRTWIEALRDLRRRIEAIGVMVVVNGVVGNNTHRRLDPEEFRGFVLVDEYAPLVFINNADFISAQMFTLIHELAHLWIAESGVSNFEEMQPISNRIELFCNAVAAEVLTPRAELEAIWGEVATDPDRFSTLARTFKVSTIVAARRALDLQLITRAEFFGFYEAWQNDERRERERRSGSGDFWNLQRGRIGDRFGLAVVRAVAEDRLLYRDAYSLTGLKGKTFDNFVREMEAHL